VIEIYRSVIEKPQVNTFLKLFEESSTVCPIHNIIIFNHRAQQGEKGWM